MTLCGSIEAPCKFLFAKEKPEWLQTCCEDHACFLVDACLPLLLEDAEKNANDSHRMYETVNALQRLTTILRQVEFRLAPDQEERLLAFALHNIDYTVDVVGYLCSSILAEIVRLRSSVTQDSAEFKRWITPVAHKLVQNRALSKSRCKALLQILRECHPIDVLSEEFFVRMYAEIGNPSLSVQISQLITEDMCLFPSRRPVQLASLKQALVAQSVHIRRAIYQRLLPSIFKNAQLLTFVVENFEELCDLPDSDQSLEAVLTLTRFAVQHQKSHSKQLAWNDLIKEERLVKGILHASHELRLAAWDLLCEHPKLTRPVSSAEVRLAKLFMSSNMAEQSPATRHNMFASLKKLLLRIREGINLLKKANDKETLSLYGEFLRFLHNTGVSSLRPHANFNRRLSALNILEAVHVPVILKSGEFDSLDADFGTRSWRTADVQKAVLSCLDDPYQLCQITALDLLRKMHISRAVLDPFTEETKRRMISIRSQYQSSSFYRLQLLCDYGPETRNDLLAELVDAGLRQQTLLAESLTAICERAPVHATLLSIQAIIDAWSDFTNDEWRHLVLEKVVPLCFGVADLVMPVAHSMFPEGFTLDEFDDSIGSRPATYTPQHLLVGCWRSLKCISAIFERLVADLPYPSVIRASLINRIGRYFWLQLTECKHCGAFETASSSFEKLCRKLWVLTAEDPVEGDETLITPDLWLEQIIEALKGGKDIHKLCCTRRSAGLPHLVGTIISTEPAANKFSRLGTTLEFLLTCREMAPEFEVHCVNIAKSLFANTTLSEVVLKHVEKALHVSIEGCAQAYWPVRNAHCQLFAALIQRVFGTPRAAQRSLHVQQRCKMSAADFFTRYPSIYDDFRARLQAFGTNQSEFHIFAVLVCLSHVYPTMQSDKYPTSVFAPDILRIMLTCHGEKLRELAVAALLSTSDVSTIRQLFEVIATKQFLRNATENQLKAMLNLVSGIYETGMANNELLTLIQEFLTGIFAYRCPKNICDFTLEHLISLISLLGLDEVRQAVVESFIHSSAEWNTRNWKSSARSWGSLVAHCQHLWPAFFGAFPAQHANLATEIRYEAYRWMRKTSIEPSDKVLDNAIEDISACSSEFYLDHTVHLLSQNVRSISKPLSAILQRNATELLEQRSLRTLSTKLHLKSLLFRMNDYARLSPLDMEFFDQALRSDDSDVRDATLALLAEVVDHSEGPTREGALKKASLTFQDEASDLRQKASELLSRHFGETTTQFPLNPSICWSLALQRFPDLSELVLADNTASTQQTPEEDHQLFEACARNPYAEPFGIDTIDEVVVALEAL